MVKIVVNNPNILVDASFEERRDIRADQRDGRLHGGLETALVRQVRQFRQRIEELVCSATWAEDCVFRGVDYAPDFRCRCPTCRKFFPKRRYPRAVRESAYSMDCQVETDEDPEFAEEFARLRNERPRYGSVFARRPRISMEKN